MELTSNVNVTTDHWKVEWVSGATWEHLIPGAVFVVAGQSTRYFVAGFQKTDHGEPPAELYLRENYVGPTLSNVPAILYQDYTPKIGLPLISVGDIEVGAIFTRAMQMLDESLFAAPIPLHAPTHLTYGIDPIPLANDLDDGLCPALKSAVWSQEGFTIPTGTIIPYAGSVASYIPPGWLVCNGAAIDRNTYGALFTIIGTVYGIGDGISTFNLPNLIDRVEIGAGNAYGLASLGGVTSHTLSVAEMPVHTHGTAAHNHADPGHVHIMQPHVHYIGFDAVTSTPGGGYEVMNYPGTVGDAHTSTETPTMNSVSCGLQATTVAIDPTGGGAGFSILPPYIALNKLIKY